METWRVNGEPADREAAETFFTLGIQDRIRAVLDFLENELQLRRNPLPEDTASALDESIMKRGFTGHNVAAYPDQDMTFTEKELVVISDIMRRVDPASLMGQVFGSRPEFTSALEKIEAGKSAAWKGRSH
jgi:hypothetical protein